MTRLLPTARKATESKEWTNLIFTLTKSDNKTLILGNSNYPIKKDNGLFNSIMSFDYKDKERTIPIEVYINTRDNVREFSNFFNSTGSYEKSEVYDIKIEACKGLKYIGICCTFMTRRVQMSISLLLVKMASKF